MKKHVSTVLAALLLSLLIPGCASVPAAESAPREGTPPAASTPILPSLPPSSTPEPSPEPSPSPSSPSPEPSPSAAPAPSPAVEPSPSVAPSPSPAPTPSPSPAPSAAKADVDLTALSSTMVYAEVYNIMMNPRDYLGKTIKMSGPYYALYFAPTEKYYHYIIIEDATACCQEGLEFVWSGDRTYPDDYPAEETRVEVTGVFDRYEEMGYTYYYLAVDALNILG